jgi:hypothetical protein
MLVDQIGEVLEDLATGSWVQLRPGTMIKCRTRRSDGGICVSRLRPGEVHECRAISCRVHCPSRAVDRGPAFAANEHGVRNLGLGGELPPIGSRYRVRIHALNQSFRG